MIALPPGASSMPLITACRTIAATAPRGPGISVSPQPPGSSDVPAHAAAGRCANLGDLPPAWIGVGDADLFVEEDRRYAERLTEAGVSCELHIAPMAPHGFEVLAPDATVTREFFG